LHNVVIQQAIDLCSKYNFIVNPDIYFTGDIDIVKAMVEYISNDEIIGMMMPQVLNED